MASCSLGTQNVKVLNLHFGGKRVGLSQQFGIRSWISRKSLQYTSLVMSQQTTRFSTSSNGPSAEIQSVTRSEEGSEETKSSGLTSELIPKFNEVEFLLTKLCDSTSIGELELKLAGFHLHVVRDLTEKTKTIPPPIPAPLSISTVTEAPKSNGSVSSSTSLSSSLAISKPISSSASIQRFLDKAADEGLVIIQSPKSDVSGEVIKILRKDGDPVGYGDALISILPSFPGIKKLQKLQ